MKYKISPQYNTRGNIIIQMTPNTTEEFIEILFSLPPQDHEGFNFVPQKDKNSVWATEFSNEDDFLSAIKKYRTSWSEAVNKELDAFFEGFDEQFQKQLSLKTTSNSSPQLSIKPSIDVKFISIFPARTLPMYTCPKCRVERDKWKSPYNVGSFASISLDLCSDVQALVTDESCFFCHSNAYVSDYQDELHAYLVDVFKCNFFNSKIYDLLGAKTVTANFDIELGKINILKFSMLGIEGDSEVLDLNLSSQGGASLTELHGNSPILGRQDYSNLEVSYYPTHLWETDGSESNKCSLMLTYIDKNIKEKNENFFQMLRSFVRRDTNAFILRGSACIEQLLYQICELELSQVPGQAGKENQVKEALTSSLSYSPQLKYIFPLVCRANGLRPLSEVLVGKLITIKNKRDKIAHKGRLEDKNDNPISLSENEFYDYAATFSSVYGLLLQLRRKINPTQA